MKKRWPHLSRAAQFVILGHNERQYLRMRTARRKASGDNSMAFNRQRIYIVKYRGKFFIHWRVKRKKVALSDKKR